ncbi:rod shape-determining protein MreD [Novosphingobium flavum]|uniref:Rod shape-determining protein MreD n=1 Tax=Novosphingobium aerophilum TaxID=2839843 RepID=A0A7X1F937_9SPHN|nr:rod shape-determining protein MreD [Novosphingobium aerophilum]MBC2652636.1 rod shape-determining protein MreD [Novosphingobium aerophilum]MBC2660508.1 rod shape-determining protein MreD [Novosphingobium aerophilum]
MPFGLAEPGRQINRVHSPLLARAVPWLTVALASIMQTMPVIAAAPVVPPLGFMILLAWRQLHPGLLPVWAGLPLGLVDDLYSGQPMGSAMFLWSVAMITLDLVEQRFPWRSYLVDWAVAAGFIGVYLVLSGILAAPPQSLPLLQVLGPQLVLSILLFPLSERFIALCDRLRLARFRSIA